MEIPFVQSPQPLPRTTLPSHSSKRCLLCVKHLLSRDGPEASLATQRKNDHDSLVLFAAWRTEREVTHGTCGDTSILDTRHERNPRSPLESGWLAVYACPHREGVGDRGQRYPALRNPTRKKKEKNAHAQKQLAHVQKATNVILPLLVITTSKPVEHSS